MRVDATAIVVLIFKIMHCVVLGSKKTSYSLLACQIECSVYFLEDAKMPAEINTADALMMLYKKFPEYDFGRTL